MDNFINYVNKDDPKPVLTVDFYKQAGNVYSYKFNNISTNISEDFVVMCLAQAMYDIVNYNNDPNEIIEAIEEILIKLGSE